MTESRFSHLATELLADEPLARTPPTADAEARAVAAIAAALRGRRRRVVMARATVGIAAAAALVLVVALAATRARPSALGASSGHAVAPVIVASAISPGVGAEVVRAGEGAPLEPRLGLAPGDSIRASASGSTGIGLADGSRLEIERASEVSITSLSTTRTFVLVAGAVQARVSKLPAGERFVVETEDAVVEVHGTAFRVALAPRGSECAPTRTRVSVSEGNVAVRFQGREEHLAAGDHWPSACASEASPPRDGVAETPVDVPAPPTSGRPAVAVSTGALRTAPGTHALAEQNRLFAEATAARRRGDLAASLAAYDRLLATYPHGVLAESVEVERMRTLSALDPQRAREAARAYLARHPQGFATAEAVRMAGNADR